MFSIPCSVVAILAVIASPIAAIAADKVRFRDGDEARNVTGRVVVAAQDGGLLVESRDGILWAIEPQEIISRQSIAGQYAPLSRAQFARGLLDALPAGFQSHETAHYVICYDTSRAYAIWCGGLFERLHNAFTNFFTRRGFDLHEPDLPLPVIVFADADKYAAFASEELGDAASSIVAYYSLRTNRVIMHDLTGVEALRPRQGTGRRSLNINALLSQPAAEPLVATIVHEATHQIAFNCGLHTRYADVPLWLSEGLAIYFETPDLSSDRGWRGIGQVGRRRLATYRSNLAGRAPDRLAQLVSSDRLFRDTRAAPAAYADAWALTFYLLRARQDEYLAYVKHLAGKQRLVWDDEATRLAEFKEHFGDDLGSLDVAVREYLGRVR